MSMEVDDLPKDDPWDGPEERERSDRLAAIERLVGAVPYGSEGLPDPEASRMAVFAIQSLLGTKRETPAERISRVRGSADAEPEYLVKPEPMPVSGAPRYDLDAMALRMMFGRGHVSGTAFEADLPPREKAPDVSQDELEARPYRVLLPFGPPAFASSTFADALGLARRYLRRNLGDGACLAAADGCSDDGELERRAGPGGHVALYVRWPDEDGVVTGKGAFAVIARKAGKGEGE